MDTQEGLRLIATLVGGGFLVCAAVAVFRGTLYDVDDGRVDRAARPVTFWLLVFGMTILGLSILSVGWQWPIVGTIGRVLGSR
jgi:spore maturation protein SpmA